MNESIREINNMETMSSDNSSETEERKAEKNYVLDGEYRRYEMQCADCQKEFTRNIPAGWFNNEDKIVARNLPEEINLEDVERVFNDPLCGACQPETKEKLEKFKSLNSKNK